MVCDIANAANYLQYSQGMVCGSSFLVKIVYFRECKLNCVNGRSMREIIYQEIHDEKVHESDSRRN